MMGEEVRRRPRAEWTKVRGGEGKSEGKSKCKSEGKSEGKSGTSEVTTFTTHHPADDVVCCERKICDGDTQNRCR
jgi:hypothetical protein